MKCIPLKTESGGYLISGQEQKLAISHYKADEVIFYPNTIKDKVFYLLKGLVHLSMSGADGSQKIFALLKPGEIIGEMSFLDRYNEYTATAISDCELLRLNIQGIFSSANNDIYIIKPLITALCRRILLVYRQLELSIFADSQKALAYLLYQLTKHYSTTTTNGKVIVLSLSQEELSFLIGTSRVTVNTLLKEFAKQGIIKLDYRKIVVLDDNKLKEIFKNY